MQVLQEFVGAAAAGAAGVAFLFEASAERSEASASAAPAASRAARRGTERRMGSSGRGNSLWKGKLPRKLLPELFHHGLERLPGRAGPLHRKCRQRLVREPEKRQEVLLLRLDVDQAGQELAILRCRTQRLKRLGLLRRVVVCP